MSFLQSIRRDLRSSELLALLVALTLSVAALSSVSFLADRVQRAFQFDARQLLAADLLLVSDQPMTPEGVKTAESDSQVTATYVDNHLQIGIESLKQLINQGLTVKHLHF